MITFNNQYFDTLESANYFGVNEGGVRDQQTIDNTRTHWIDRMHDEGYQFGTEYDPSDDEFEADAQKCLEDAIELACA